MAAAACRRRKQPPLPNRISSLAILLLIFFFLILLQHPVTTTADVPDDEKQALLLFRDKVKHHPSYSWNPSEPVCPDPPKEEGDDKKKKEVHNWKGVTCDADNLFVIRLIMPAASLVGEIPPGTIGNLVNLRVLTLRENGLNGTIPDDFSKLKLTQLNLHKNKISGHLSNILQTDLLEKFDVSSNHFTGDLPDMKSEKLEYFDVSNNHFKGSIPESLSALPPTSFAGNINLCGPPLIKTPCKGNVPQQPPSSESQAEKETSDKNKKTTEKRLIVGVSIGSGLLLLFFLCCLGKRMSKKPLAASPSQDLEYSASTAAIAAGKSTELGDERNKLVFLDAGIYNFDMEDLYQASTELLGKGSVGTSLKAVMNGGSTTVVVKRFKDVVVTKDKFESTMEVLGKMKNEHLIPLRAYYYSKDEKLIVYDYMPAGSLFAHLHNGNRDTRLDWERRMRIALSAARGVEYLHVVGKVVHGNIKSSNILFRQEANKDASVSDYGLNILFDTSSSQNHQVTCYQAPEVLNTREVTFESDVYSFGVLLLELLTGKDPNQTSLDKDGIEFPRWVQSITHEELKAEGLDVELRRHQNIEEKMVQLFQIAKDCLLLEPNRRPTMHKVVRMMEDMNRVEIDEWVRQSSDDHSKPFDDTPSTETRDTPSTITP